MNLLYCAGVEYWPVSENNLNEKLPDECFIMQKVLIHRRYFPKDERSDFQVYVYHHDDVYKLVNYWNSDIWNNDWRYWV